MSHYGCLVLLGAEGDDVAYVLSAEQVVIGRDPTADITLNDPGASRRHATLSCSGEGVSIQDLGSRNGTFLNRRSLQPRQPVALRAGDVVTIGQTQLRYTTPDRASATGDAVPTATVVAGEPRLIVETPGHTWHQVLGTAPITIGSAADNDVVLDDAEVDPHHARVTAAGAVALFEDLGSTHGSYAGDERIGRRQWAEGESIRLGRCRLYYRPSQAAAQATLADTRQQIRLPGWRRPDQQRLVVLVPGLMGSELYWRPPGTVETIRLWPNLPALLKHMEVTKWPGQGISVGDIIADTAVVEGLYHIEGYSKLVRFLVEFLGYVPQRTLLTAPYDWRQDIAASARDLARAIDGWSSRGKRLVTLVGHSMGALVARYYVEHLGGERCVERLILLGGPYRGTPKGFLGLLEGPVFGPMKLVADRIAPLHRSFPSTYQILPTYPFITDQNGETVDIYEDDHWLAAEYRPMLHKGRGFLAALAPKATLPTTVIWGYGQKTITGLTVCRRDGVWQNVEPVYSEEGDGGVPYASALLEGADLQPVAQTHGALHVDRDVQMRLRLELLNNP